MKFHSDFWGRGGRTAGLGSLGAAARAASLGQLQEHRLAGRQVRDVPGARELVGDVLRRLQLAQLDEAVARGGKRVGDQLGCLGVTLGGDDGRLLLLLGLRGGAGGRPGHLRTPNGRRESPSSPPSSKCTSTQPSFFPATRRPPPGAAGLDFCWRVSICLISKFPWTSTASQPGQLALSPADPSRGRQERGKKGKIHPQAHLSLHPRVKGRAAGEGWQARGTLPRAHPELSWIPTRRPGSSPWALLTRVGHLSAEHDLSEVAGGGYRVDKC